MKLAAISFTRKGSVCCKRLVEAFENRSEHCFGYVPERFLEAGASDRLVPFRQSLAEWTGERFDDCEGIIFIGAAGIAVRAIAPYIKDKKTDPAIVVVDETGTWVISLLAGHMGGANRLTGIVAEILAGTPVITTATDMAGKTAIDVYAREAGLQITDWELAKRVSAEVLEGEPVGFFSDFPWPEEPPKGFFHDERHDLSVWITGRCASERLMGDAVLRLVPGMYCVGIGCRRDTPGQVIREAVVSVMEEHNLAVEGITALSSIDIKRDEAGILETAHDFGVKVMFFSAGELQAVRGEFSVSPFVRQITGVDNVCERAALAGVGEGGILMIKKQVRNKVTVAVAVKPPGE